MYLEPILKSKELQVKRFESGIFFHFNKTDVKHICSFIHFPTETKYHH